MLELMLEITKSEASISYRISKTTTFSPFFSVEKVLRVPSLSTTIEIFMWLFKKVIQEGRGTDSNSL